MKRYHRQRGRAAFTLIELLVVMAIIAVLVSLTAAAIFQFLDAGPKMQARSELTQLDAAVGQFEAKFRVDYLPSLFVLDESGTYAVRATNPPLPTNMPAQRQQRLFQDSRDYLRGMFGASFRPTGAGMGIDWNGNGAIDQAPHLLTGDQCLVFFLGGIPQRNPPACRGFSTDPRNPTNFNPAKGQVRRDTIGPFYEGFTANRLRMGANGFFSYIDAFENQPYAYLCSYKVDNGYNRYGICDCFTLGGLQAPYVIQAKPTVRFHNPRSFQIISAGEDGGFGPGGLWGPGTMLSPPGQDDMTNFHDGLMGTP